MGDDFLRDTLGDIRDRLIRVEGKLDGYDRDRCERHTERLQVLASRMDTAEEARAAIARQNERTWQRLAASLGMMAAIAALVTLGLRVLGL